MSTNNTDFSDNDSAVSFDWHLWLIRFLKRWYLFVISLAVFTVIVMFLFKGETLQWNHFAAFACLILAVFFVFLK